MATLRLTRDARHVLLRLGERRWAGLPLGDLLLGGLALLVALASALAGRPDEGPFAVVLPVAAILAGSLCLRSRLPLAACVVATCAGIVQAVVAEQPGSLWAFAIYLILVYSVAADAGEARAAAGGIIVVGGQLIMERIDTGVDYVFVVLVFGGAWLLGRLTRGWHLRATQAEEHQRDLARVAVAEERVRIARELHDAVAHGLSVIAVQADAAEAALAHDPELAVAPLRAIRSSARDALSDLRQMLTVLRPADGDTRPRGYADLPQLLDGIRAAGLPIDARVPAGLRLAPAVELAVYRIIQEALTNVLKHAGPVDTSVQVTSRGDEVRIVVTNAPSTRTDRVETDGGHGLLGLRERARSVGGTLAAAPTADGGWRVEARLPCAGSVGGSVGS